jgi:hypothetical protein
VPWCSARRTRKLTARALGKGKGFGCCMQRSSSKSKEEQCSRRSKRKVNLRAFETCDKNKRLSKDPLVRISGSYIVAEPSFGI